MSSQRFILFTVILFLVGALPFMIAQPTAAASAGLSLGFSAPLEHWPVLVLLMLVGLCAALLPRDGLLLLPIAFTMMIMVGGMLRFDAGLYPSLRYFILGAILCMSLLVGIARQKLTILNIMILASLGFHLGGFYLAHIPTIASPIYFLLGVLLSLSMVLAISVAFGVTVFGDNEATWEKIKKSPRVAFIRNLLS
jgi:urease accessory protein